MRPPLLSYVLFTLIYPPHLLVLRTTLGLRLHLQTYPYSRALYVISIHQTKSLLTASFRFHLTIDALAVQIYTSSLPRHVWDFHPLELISTAILLDHTSHKLRTSFHIQFRLLAHLYFLCDLITDFMYIINLNNRSSKGLDYQI